MFEPLLIIESLKKNLRKRILMKINKVLNEIWCITKLEE